MSETVFAPAGTATSRFGDYVALLKLRIVFMVLMTTLVGFHLGASGAPEIAPVLNMLLGTALAAGGTLALNQYMERDLDGLMVRTKMRPLPDGRLQPAQALVFGSLVLLSGLAHLLLFVNGVAMFVTLAISVTYLLVYTPLKPRTSLSSIAGAVPGALPPVAGWAAARGTIDAPAWVLFAIMFLWQIPHTLAIARLYRDDFSRAGIRLLPVIDPDGPSTGTHAVACCLGLLPVALMPTVIGLAGRFYFVAALLLGSVFLRAAIGLARRNTLPEARRLLFASLIYLPALLTVMALDKIPH